MHEKLIHEFRLAALADTGIAIAVAQGIQHYVHKPVDQFREKYPFFTEEECRAYLTATNKRRLTMLRNHQ